MTTPAASVTINGVTFETSYLDNNSFAQLIIDSYNAGIPIRSPGREFVLENSTSSTYVMSGFANSEIIPDDIMGTSAYLDSVIDQVDYLPAGYIVTFMTEPTNIGNGTVSNLTYQQITEGTWNLINSFEFNTIKSIASYNEYNDGSNNPL